MKQKGIYLIVHAIILGIIELLAFTVLNEDYLFEWVAHNWIYYLILAAVVLLLVVFDKKIVSVCMTAGISLGIFIGSFLGNTIKLHNMNKIVESMTGEEIYRLRHHYGFEIWLGIILFSFVIGFMIQVIVIKSRRSDN